MTGSKQSQIGENERRSANGTEQEHRQRKKITERTHDMSFHPSFHSYSPISFFLSCLIVVVQCGASKAVLWLACTHTHTSYTALSFNTFHSPHVYPNLHPTSPSQMSTRREGWCSRSNSAS